MTSTPRLPRTASAPLGTGCGMDLLDTTTHARRSTTLNSSVARVRERGMSTAEYAVGILAAVTFALVLLRIFNDNKFFKTTFDVVVKLLKWTSDKIV